MNYLTRPRTKEAFPNRIRLRFRNDPIEAMTPDACITLGFAEMPRRRFALEAVLRRSETAP
jgi:hypothetical protein